MDCFGCGQTGSQRKVSIMKFIRHEMVHTSLIWGVQVDLDFVNEPVQLWESKALDFHARVEAVWEIHGVDLILELVLAWVSAFF